jgi:hypothetical protein
MVSFRYVIVNTLHKDDDDDDDDNNNNNNISVDTLHKGDTDDDDDDDDNNNNNSLDTRRAGTLTTSETSGCKLKVHIHN